MDLKKVSIIWSNNTTYPSGNKQGFSLVGNKEKMSGLLQLVSNYYKAVVESERIYNEYRLTQQREENKISRGDSSDKKEVSALVSPNPTDLVTLQLQKQVNKLTSQIQGLTKRNDQLAELNKAQRITSEHKIKNLTMRVKDLQEEKSIQYNKGKHTPSTPKKSKDDADQSSNNSSNKLPKFHLLSPLGKNISNSSRGSSHTIFDDSTSESDDADADNNKNEAEGDATPSADSQPDDIQNSNTKKNNSDELDPFVLSLKKYDQTKSNERLDQVLKGKKKQLKKRNNHKITPTKHKAIDKTTVVKKLNELNIPKLNKGDGISNKKRKLSNKKIQVTSDNDELLPIASQ